MILKALSYAGNRFLHWCGAYFLTVLAIFACCRPIEKEPPSIVVWIPALLCTAYFVYDLLCFFDRLHAKLEATQIGKRLLIHKGDMLVATAILKDDHPLTRAELEQILQDVAKFESTLPNGEE